MDLRILRSLVALARGVSARGVMQIEADHWGWGHMGVGETEAATIARALSRNVKRKRSGDCRMWGLFSQERQQLLSRWETAHVCMLVGESERRHG